MSLSCLLFFVFWILIIFYGYFILGNEVKSTEIDNNISQAVRNFDKISMPKNIFDGRMEMNVTAEKATSFKRNTSDIWKNYGHFKQQSCDFSIGKANLPENSVLYINQAYQSCKDNKKVFYTDYFVLGQFNQCLNPPEDLKTYVCQPSETKIYKPKYDTATGEFLGLCETLAYLTVRGDNFECFFDYGYSKENSKILYSHHKMGIPNSLSAIFCDFCDFFLILRNLKGKKWRL